MLNCHLGVRAGNTKLKRKAFSDANMLSEDYAAGKEAIWTFSGDDALPCPHATRDIAIADDSAVIWRIRECTKVAITSYAQKYSTQDTTRRL